MMHEKAAQRHRRVIADAVVRDPANVDFWLDQYADNLLRATEWDAAQWGFDPDRWMRKERAELARRGGPDWPTEAAV